MSDGGRGGILTIQENATRYGFNLAVEITLNLWVHLHGGLVRVKTEERGRRSIPSCSIVSVRPLSVMLQHLFKGFI